MTILTDAIFFRRSFGRNSVGCLAISHNDNSMNRKNVCSEILIEALFVRAKVGNNLSAYQQKSSEIMVYLDYSSIKKNELEL